MAVALENFDKMFETRSRLNRISGIEKREVYLTPMPPMWPFNLFQSLLENQALPKYWVPDVNDKPDLEDEEE